MGKRQNFPKPEGFQPEPSWPKKHRWAGLPGRCQAWNPVHGRQCLRRAVPGKRVCKFDGGASDSGIAHYNWQGKGHSRSGSMPPKLAPIMERALNDPDLLALNVDIATVEALLTQTVETLIEGDLIGLFSELRQLWTRLWAAIRREDREATAAFRGQLAALLDRGSAQSSSIVRFLDLTEQKRKLVETEAKRREKMNEFVRAEEVARDYRALAVAVKRVVEDKDQLRKIQQEFDRIVGLDYLARAESADVPD